MNIIKQMTRDCQREDCDIIGSNTSISNSFETSSVWNCRTCQRAWAVAYRYPEPVSYGKDGEPKPQDEEPPRITEIVATRPEKKSPIYVMNGRF